MENSRNIHFSQLDTDQIIKKRFDASMDADRVILVGGEKLDISIDSDKIANAIKDSLSNINQSSKSEIQIIEKNVFIPKIERVEVPVIIKEIEYKTIEIPFITERIVTVEKPIYIKEIEFKEIIKERHYPLLIKVTTIIQTLCVLGLLILTILKRSA